MAAAVAVLCLAGVLLDATADVLPDQPLVGLVTPLRLVLGVGLVAAVVGLGSPLRCRTALDPAVAALVLAAAVATAAAGQDWSGWRAVLTAVAAFYLAVGVGRSGPELPAAIPGDEPFQHAHNLWLNWAVEAGYPGLAAVLALTVACRVVAVRASRHPLGIGAAALGAGLAGFAVMTLADHPANAARLSVTLWIVVGLLAAAASPGPVRPPDAADGADGADGDTATTVLPATAPPAGTASRRSP